MKRALTSIAICLTLLVPAMTYAKKPNVDSGCTLFVVQDYVLTGELFTVKLVKTDPVFPGAFFYPTASIDVTYPMPPGSGITQNSTVSIDRFNVRTMEADFNAPLFSSGILTGEQVKIAATVAEPVAGRKKKKVTARCTTTATVLQAN